MRKCMKSRAWVVAFTANKISYQLVIRGLSLREQP